MHTSVTDQLQPRLTRRSPHSFDCFDIETFTAWLTANGFREIPRSRSLVEHSRWERSFRLVIIYKSSAVVVSGYHPEPCLKLLAQLVVEPQREMAVRV
jgi:hypothetical protein